MIFFLKHIIKQLRLFNVKSNSKQPLICDKKKRDLCSNCKKYMLWHYLKKDD